MGTSKSGTLSLSVMINYKKKIAMTNKLQLFIFTLLIIAVGCTETPKEVAQDETSFEAERTAILNTINDETKAAFTRDYLGWKDKWVHEPYVAKTYMDFSDSSFTETLGWEEIDNFVRTYIEDHPEPDPVPELVSNIDVRLYGSGAWVSYAQNDATRGLKRETRLMEKVDGQWKIAGMHTTIYGFLEGR